MHLTLVLAVAVVCGSASAATTRDHDIQTLVNFPALKKIADSGEIRVFVKRVSAAYAKAGYNDFAPEFRRSGGEIIEQFAGNAQSLKDSRQALRRLQRALDRDNFYVLPANVGERVPNYRDLATVFLSNTKTALKNIATGKPIGHKLAGKTGTFWLTRTDRETVEPTGSYNDNGSLSSGLDNGSLSSGLVSFSGDVTITAGGILDLPKTVAFPPGIALPPEDKYKLIATLGEPDVFADVELPSGTLLITVPSDFVLPEGTVLISPFGLPFGGRSVSSFIGNFSFTGVTDTRWVAFPPDTVLPANPLRPTFRLNASYTVNEIALPGGSLIRQMHDSFPIPEGATDLGGPGLQAIQTGPSLF